VGAPGAGPIVLDADAAARAKDRREQSDDAEQRPDAVPGCCDPEAIPTR
jgi:hypothetical protein